MSDDEIIAVVQASKEGKRIQQKCYGEWRNCYCPDWDFKHSDYRVAPEPRKPREWFLVRDQYKTCWWEYPCRQSHCDREQIHVREVLENE